MEDTPLLVSLLKRMNENQLALGPAIEELSNWVEQRGSTEVAQCSGQVFPDTDYGGQAACCSMAIGDK